MKCPACWADKAYRRNEQGMLASLLRMLLFVPMRCRHCYHKFWVHRALAVGQVIEPPARPQATPTPEKSRLTAEFLAQQAERNDSSDGMRRRAS